MLDLRNEGRRVCAVQQSALLDRVSSVLCAASRVFADVGRERRAVYVSELLQVAYAEEERSENEDKRREHGDVEEETKRPESKTTSERTGADGIDSKRDFGQVSFEGESDEW